MDDRLNESLIRESLLPEHQNIEIRIQEQTDSTNTDAKSAAHSGCADKTVFIANEQRLGRGRCGKSFFSPKNGIYLSTVLQNSKLLTIAAAVAVNRAIQRAAAIETKIKWVNDLFYKEKKVCGILCEAVDAKRAVIGIGINFRSAEEYPVELKDIAGALFDKDCTCTRNKLIAQILNELFSVTVAKQEQIIQSYREKMFLLGETVTYIQNGIKYTAAVKDIDLSGGLTVINTDGRETILRSGEVSICRKK